MLYLISSLHLGSYLLCLVHNRGGGRRKAIAKYVCNLCRRVLCSCRGRRVSLISYFIVCWVLWSHAVCSFSKQYFSICLSSSCYFLFPNWLKVFVCNLLINCLCLTPSGASLPVLYVSPDQLFLLLSCDPQWAVIIPVLEPMAAWRAVQCPVTCNPTPAPIHVGFILVQSWMWYSCTDSPALPALSLCSWCVLDSLTVPVVDSLREWRLVWTGVIGLCHLWAGAVQASRAAPPSPTLLCNCAGTVAVLQPGAKPEEANGAATGLRRAPSQKCVLDLMTRVLFQTFYRGQSMAGNFPLSSS